MTKIKYIILLIIGFIFLNYLVYFFTEQNKNQRIELSLQSHSKKLQTHYEILKHQQKLTADSAYESTLKKAGVIEIVSEAYINIGDSWFQWWGTVSSGTVSSGIGGIDEYTVLMLHLDGDESDSQHIVTFNRDPKYSSTVKKF